MKTNKETGIMDETLAKELAEDRVKKLEIMRVRNIACITMGCAVSDLGKEGGSPMVARLLIMTHLLSKGYATVDITRASTIAKKDIDINLERYYKIKERSAHFRELETSFFKRIELCCAKT